jgi:hypothetical protein
VGDWKGIKDTGWVGDCSKEIKDTDCVEQNMRNRGGGGGVKNEDKIEGGGG